MAKFLNTSATNYYLEELLKHARERIIVISPYLKFNDRIKELIEDKDRLKIDIRIIYGKSELAPQEINWLHSLEFVRTSFCQNLHAKCYMSESEAIITSMNLYDFSQVNNNEMGVHIDRDMDYELYQDTYEEAQRFIRISEQVRLSAETIVNDEENTDEQDDYEKLTTSKLAKELGLKTAELVDELVKQGYLEQRDNQWYITEIGKEVGGEFRFSKRYGPYFLWPRDMRV